MLRSEIEEKVKEFMIEDFEVDEEKISPDARLREDLGIDSLDVVDIIVLVNKIFGFRIKSEEMAGMVTMSQFCDFIEQRTTR